MKNEVNTIAVTDDLIVNYLTGEIGPDEAMVLHDWLESPGNREYFEKFQSVWQHAHPAKKPRLPDHQQAWVTLQDKLMLVYSRPQQNSNLYNHRNLIFRIAATFLLVAVIGLFVYQKFWHESLPKISIETKGALRPIILPDHSQTIMSRNTKLAYTQNFEGLSRDVYLSGEAFFKVAHNKTKPFIVHTVLGNIKAIGTAFNVAIKNGKVEISVVEGKVLIYNLFDSVYLEAGYIGTIISGPKSIHTGAVTSLDINKLGYATRKFEFENTMLADVFKSIEKSYPYSISVNNEAIKNCKLTASFEDKSVDYIVKLIAETLDFKLTKKEHVFVFEGNGCR